MTVCAQANFTVSGPQQGLQFSAVSGSATSPRAFSVTSTGNADVTGLGASISTNADLWNIVNNCPPSLQPGGTCEFELRLAPPAGTTAVGVNANFTINSSNAGQATAIPIAGQVTLATVSASPPSLTFTAAAGTITAPQTVTFTAVDGAVSDIAILLSASPFQVTADNCTGAGLGIGQSCTVSVIFVAPTGVGGYGQSLQFQAAANLGASIGRASLHSANLAATVTAGDGTIQYTITTTAETGPGSWGAAVADIHANQCAAPKKRITFNIPAATDPGCNAATGVCIVEVGQDQNREFRCPDVEVDGTTQPGWMPNTSTDRTTNGALKIELAGRDALFVYSDRFIVKGIAFGPLRLVHFVRKVSGQAFETVGPTVTGNYFGLQADGLTGIAGLNGNRIRLNEGDVTNLVNTRIGGPSPADRNLFVAFGVSANGIALQGASGSVIEGNLFNLDRNGNAAGTRLTNAIFVRDARNDNNLIRRNVIAGPLEYGFVCIGQGVGNTLTENQIFDANFTHLNAIPPQQWAINPFDCNRQQAAPSIAITAYGATVDVQGTLNSAPSETFRIEYFHNDTPDEQNYGRAERFIAAMEVTTNSGGTATFSTALPAFARNVSATATRLSTGDTSPFSAAVTSPPNIDKFTVTPSATGGGTISPATPQQVTNSFTATFTVTPDANHIVLMGGTCGGNLVGTTFTTVPVDRNCTVTAEFRLRQYSVVPTNGTDGNMAPDTLTRVDHGATLSFLLLGNPGFDPSVTGTCGGTLVPSPTQANAATFTTNPVTADCTVISSFALSNVTHTVTPSAGAGGSISPSSPVSVIHGQTQTFSLIPSPGFRPLEVTGTCSGNTLPDSYTTIPITTDCTVMASFLPLSWTITPIVNGNGSTSPNMPFQIANGHAFNINIQADAGYQLNTGGTCNGTLYAFAGGAYMFAGSGAVADCTFIANFTLIPDPTITVGSGGLGTITSIPPGMNCASPGTCSAVFPLGTVVTIIPTPAPNWVHGGYAGCPQSGVATGPCTFTATGNVFMNSGFSQVATNITVVKAGSGSGTVTGTGFNCGATCTITVPYGPGFTLTATPDAGSIFRGFTGAPCNPGNTCAIDTGVDRTITATFDRDESTFTVTNTNGSGPGSFTDVLSTIYNAGSDFCLPGVKTIAFNIPAATDPGCNAATGICSIPMPNTPSEQNIRCGNLIIDGYTQPGAQANTATDRTNNAQIKIELGANLTGNFAGAIAIGRATTHPFGNITANNVTIRGIAFPRHSLLVRTGNSGSVPHGGGGHVVAGNVFGWHADGTPAVTPISEGIHLYGAFLSGSTIGGPNPADRNMLTNPSSANALGIRADGAANVLFEGNYINIDRNGAPVAAAGMTGIRVWQDNGNNTPPSRDNVIRRNVIVTSNSGPVFTGTARGNTVTENIMFGHPANVPAISFFSISGGGTNPQLPPVITSVSVQPGQTVVSGTVSGDINGTIRLEFFSNPTAYTGNGGQADTFHGNLDVLMDANGEGSFSKVLPAGVQHIGVTATRLSTGDTSMFSSYVAPVAQSGITVTLAGTGSGTVTSVPAGIVDCPSACSGGVAPGTLVQLIATPAADSIFTGWTTNACLPNGATCQWTADGNLTATATFKKVARLTLLNAIDTIMSPVGPLCATGVGVCRVYDLGTMVLVGPQPSAGSEAFVGWDGVAGCAGPGACLVNMDQNQTLTAVYGQGQVPRTVTPSASGNGTISPATPLSVTQGATATFVVTPAPGHYATVGGTCGGTLVGNTFTTLPVTAGCTVIANFTAGVKYVVTTTAENGPGSWTAALLDINNNQCAAPTKRIEFNIPATTDPGCDTGTGICRVSIPFDSTVRCSQIVIDGYSQPGASPNTSTDMTNNAQIKVEFSTNIAGTSPGQIAIGLGGDVGPGTASNVTVRGIAFPKHTLQIRPGGSGSVLFGDGGGHVVAGNVFGWHADGTAASGPVSLGIRMFGAFLSGNTIGGPNPSDRNMFTNPNKFASPGISGDGIQTSLFEGNYFNIDKLGQPNSAIGIFGGIGVSGSLGNGTPGSRNNVIRRNVLSGIDGTPISTGSGNGNTVTENLMFGHAAQRPGIGFLSIAGGGSNPQEPPVVIEVVTSSSGTVVRGYVAADANTQVKLEFFDNAQAYIGGAGRAEVFLASYTVTTDSGATAPFEVTLPAGSQHIAVTATRVSSGDTSMFSNYVAPQALQFFKLVLVNSPDTILSPVGPQCATPPGDVCRVYPQNTNVLVNPPPAPAGQVFTGWASNAGCNTPAPCLVNMALDRTLTAQFAPQTFTVTPMPDENGSMQPGIPQTVVVGSTVTFRLVTNMNRGVRAGGTCGGTQNGFFYTTAPVTADCTVTAEFGDGPYTVTPSVIGNGSISPSGPQTTMANGSVHYQTSSPPNHRMVLGGTCGSSLDPFFLSRVVVDFVRFDCTVTFTFEFIDFPQLEISPSTLGGGTVGLVVSSPPGISCPGTCSANFPVGSTVTLTADDGTDTIFEEWSGFSKTCKESNNRTCAVTMSTPMFMNPVFRAIAPLTLDVTGRGTVAVSAPNTADCTGAVPATRCTYKLVRNSTTSLQAHPTAPAVFLGWSGACSGTGACSVSMANAQNVTASFTPQDTAPPVAALSAQPTIAHAGSAVTLSGAGSTDQSGLVANYRFTAVQRPAGASAFATPATSSTPTFTFTPDVAGTWRISLVVTDDSGNNSAAVELMLTVLPADTIAPIAIIEGPLTGKTNLPITLSGAASQDLGGNIVEYRWTRSIPRYSKIGNDPVSGTSPTFTFTPDVVGVYSVTLRVVDDSGNVSAGMRADVRISDGDAPVAVLIATPNPVLAGQPVKLDMSQSFDVGGSGIRFYTLSEVSRPLNAAPMADSLHSLGGPEIKEFIPEKPGKWQIRLVVSDFAGLSSREALIALTVIQPGQPTAVIDAPKAPRAPANSRTIVTDGEFGGKIAVPFKLDGKRSASTVGDITKYIWKVITTPRGSRLMPVEQTFTTSEFEFVPDVLGSYTVRLIVEDASSARSPAATVRVLISDTDDPVAVLNADPLPAMLGDTVLLDARDSFDVGGSDIRQYKFKVVQRPTGSTAMSDTVSIPGPALPLPNTPDPIVEFKPDKVGAWRIELGVEDGVGRNAVPDTLLIPVLATGGKPTAIIDAPATGRAGVDIVFDGALSGGSGLAIIKYEWTLTRRPAGSNLPLNVPDAGSSAQRHFVADTIGIYTLRLVVTDAATQESTPATATISISDTAAPVAVLEVTPSPALAGNTVTLSGAASFDVGGTGVSRYTFSVVDRPNGSTAFDTTHARPTPTFSFVPDKPGVWRFRLVVLDGLNRASEPDEVSLAVFAGVPVAPPDVMATAGVQSATLTFTVPADGGSPITGYAATCVAGNIVTATGSASPITVTGLTGGTAYSCTVTAINANGSSLASEAATVTPQSPPVPLALQEVVSRKSHGSAGSFEIDIDRAASILGGVTVEPRIETTGLHRLFFTFNQPVTTLGAVTVRDKLQNNVGHATFQLQGNVVRVTLSDIPDASRLTIRLVDANGPQDFFVSMGFLAGDVSGNGGVSASDLLVAKARGGATTNANFRADVNSSGSVDVVDQQLIRSRSGRALP